jgi:hypothetical protein
MSTLLARLSLVCLMVTMQACTVPVRQAALPVAEPGLVAFNSEEGLARLARSTARADFAALTNQFEAQSNVAFCGPTTAAIVLNAVYAGSPALPRDRSRLRADDARYLPAGWDLSVPRHTQDSVIALGHKTRAQVLGEPVTVAGRQRSDGGYQLRQLDEMLRAHGVLTRLVVVDDSQTAAGIRAELVDNLQRRGDYVIVNYKRDALGQRGGAHISPLAAYDATSDAVLLLDVNPANASWVWVPTATLISAMRTFDTVENRGYILVQAPAPH